MIVLSFNFIKQLYFGIFGAGGRISYRLCRSIIGVIQSNNSDYKSAVTKREKMK